METLLLVVTAVSLVAALFLGWTAWRLSREERERAMARVAALAAAVAEPQLSDTPARTMDAEARADTRSAWGTTPRPRATPRVTTMQAATAQEITWAPPRPEELPLRPEPTTTPAMGDAFLGTRPYQSNGGQQLVAIAAFVLLMALGAAGAWLYSAQPSTSTPAATAGGAPLELISMRHTREGDKLSVSGMVRNPANGQAVDKLSATVLLFDQQNGYLTSARGNVDIPHLGPGQESPFTLSVQAPAGAARYRVSFRTDDRLVDHVDRRGQASPAAASALPAQPGRR